MPKPTARLLWVSRDSDFDRGADEYQVWGGKKPAFVETETLFPRQFTSQEEMKEFLQHPPRPIGTYGDGRADYASVCPAMWERLGFPELEPGECRRFRITITT